MDFTLLVLFGFLERTIFDAGPHSFLAVGRPPYFPIHPLPLTLSDYPSICDESTDIASPHERCTVQNVLTTVVPRVQCDNFLYFFQIHFTSRHYQCGYVVLFCCITRLCRPSRCSECLFVRTDQSSVVRGSSYSGYVDPCSLSLRHDTNAIDAPQSKA